jgi:hypothetical protein
VRRWLIEERGSASLEFITAGLLLIVPLVYLVLTLAQLQAATLAAEGAVRQAVRVFVTAPTVVQARVQAAAAIDDALADLHLSPSQAKTAVTCAPQPRNCLASQSGVTTRTTIAVPLPLIPSMFGLDKYARISISAEATERVAR